MPKVSTGQENTRETTRVNPYNVSTIRRALTEWRNHANDYEAAAISKYRELKGYVTQHKKELGHGDAEELYELFCTYLVFFW